MTIALKVQDQWSGQNFDSPWIRYFVGRTKKATPLSINFDIRTPYSDNVKEKNNWLFYTYLLYHLILQNYIYI
jgi:hypothetical protein